MNKISEKENEPGILLGIFIIAIIVGFLISIKSEVGPVKEGLNAVLLGLYLQFWGILFLLSYYFSHKCFFFRGLIWVCENFSAPKGRKMAFFYFGLAFIFGTMGLLQGLGVFQ